MVIKTRKISKLLSLTDLALVMSDKDNVAIAKRDIPKGTILEYIIATNRPSLRVTNGNAAISSFISNNEIASPPLNRGGSQRRQHMSNSITKLTIKTTISAGHRFALCNIPKGTQVKQYSYPFGISKGISAGSEVNRSNINEIRINYDKLLKGYTAPKMGAKSKIVRSDRTFLGYRRKDGSVGTRNYYVIIPTSLCASDIAKRISEGLDKKRFPNVDGVLAAAHTEGCGSSDGVIIERLLLTLKNTILNPNVCGALIIDLGCEKISASAFLKYAGNLSKYGKTIDTLSIQKSGGTRKSVDEGKKIVISSLKKCRAKRENVSISNLNIGTECGASDSFSGITANPLIGKTVDKIIEAGGSAILSETPEMMGAEVSLVARISSKAVVQTFLAALQWYKDLAGKLQISMQGNFVPGNEKGGLINSTLKSLGAILKGGTTPIVDFLAYSQRTRIKGLSLMDGPGNDLESLTGIAAGGANLFLFSTGGGATEGSLIVPVVKISSTTELYNKLREDIDFNAGDIIDKNISIEALSEKLLDFCIVVASGKKTWSDKWKKRSFQIWSAGKLSL